MPKTVRWRGIDVDPDTADMLAAIAREAGDDIYVAGIPGYGSYRSNAASGGTDSGGGHADLNMVGYNTEQCRRVETTARKMGACAYWRPERRPDGTRYGWQNHVHILRMDCPDLSAAARAQVADYLIGFDGLYYGPGVKMPDTGDRSYTRRRWLALGPLLSKPTAVPTAGGVTTPKPAPVPKEDDMANVTDDQLARLLKAADRVLASGSTSPRLLNDGDGTTIRKDIGYIRDQILRAVDPKALAADVVAALPTGQALTQDTVEAALRNVLGSLAPDQS
jgi:hypothetical protein